MNSAKTILLIDDEEDLLQLVKIALESKGYHVETAINGIEGLARLETVKPDLIILDMNMPKMGGVEFYQRICQGTDRPSYPVLVLTARANMEQLFKQLDIDGFMTKPFEIADLLHEVEIIIQKKSNAGVGTALLGAREPSEICIIENDLEMLDKIGSVFLNAGYIVNPAQNGTEGIKRVSHTVPDVVLVQWGLVDISGDSVIFKLKRMAKTMNVKYVLYTAKNAQRHTISQKIGEKEGIDRFVEFVDPKDLLEAVEEVLKGRGA